MYIIRLTYASQLFAHALIVIKYISVFELFDDFAVLFKCFEKLIDRYDRLFALLPLHEGLTDKRFYELKLTFSLKSHLAKVNFNDSKDSMAQYFFNIPNRV